MGREVRRVPADWQHPKYPTGRYIPLRQGDAAALGAAWDEGHAKWDEGLVRTHDRRPGAPQWRRRDAGDRPDYESFAQWAGQRPRPDAYMPNWPTEQRTHWQMYEVTTAGTPLSPPCASAKDLAKWLADHHASAGPELLATEAEWLDMIEGTGRSPIFLVENGRPVSALAKPP